MTDKRIVWREMLRRLRTGNRGQSLVETAFMLPILLTILFSAVELARVAYVGIQVSNAAKAGAQYGAQNGYTAADTTGISTAAASDAMGLSGLTTTSSYTCACSDGTTSTCANTDCSSSHIVQTLTVKTQATITPLIHYPGFPASYTLKGHATQRCLQ
jgi:Flp pilus assembly protein TadG